MPDGAGSRVNGVIESVRAVHAWIQRSQRLDVGIGLLWDNIQGNERRMRRHDIFGRAAVTLRQALVLMTRVGTGRLPAPGLASDFDVSGSDA